MALRTPKGHLPNRSVLSRYPGSLFVGATVAMTIATRVAIPQLVDRGVPPVIAWFIAAGGIVFIPVVLTAHRMLRADGRSLSRRDLRLGRPSRRTLIDTALGFVVVGVASFALAELLEAVGIDLAPSYLAPPFDDKAVILLAWIPFFILNILGEEFAWRGVVLPMQTARAGDGVWPWHAAGWALMHLPIGLGVMVSAIPFYLVIAYLSVRTKSSWPGLIIHAGVAGPGFVAVLFGLVG